MLAIRYNLANLFTFDGRESRGSFWKYMLSLLLMAVIIQFIVIAFYSAEFSALAEAGETGRRDLARLQFHQSLILVGVNLLVLLLGFAAFVRRLHDSGLSAAVAVIPVLLYGVSVLYSLYYFDEIMAANSTGFMIQTPEAARAVAISPWMAILGWIGILVAIALALLQPDDGANHYGKPPVQIPDPKDDQGE